MNPVPARLLRPLAESCKSRPPPPARDHKRRDYLIEAARNMFIQGIEREREYVADIVRRLEGVEAHGYPGMLHTA
jgi:hypothetical protein